MVNFFFKKRKFSSSGNYFAEYCNNYISSILETTSTIKRSRKDNSNSSRLEIGRINFKILMGINL